jgi:L-seryl-tRNA(Ser) seleniumtransferase
MGPLAAALPWEPIWRTASPGARSTLEDNVYTRLLGVRPHLPAHDHISRLGGGRMSADVQAAMAEANEYFVDLHELLDAAGRKIATLLGAEAAMVSSGGFSAMILGAAACLTGTDPEKAAALPHPTWPRRECLIQKAQRFDYDRAYRAAGATIVTAETRAELEAMAGEKTAFIAGLSNVERQGVFAPPIEARRAPNPDPKLVKAEELIAIGRGAKVPVLIDMASDLPPWGNLRRFLDAGADLLALSGGKVIGGPQSTGILLGRKDLIEAARLNAVPFDNIGRGMKVGKEEVIGLVVALERFVQQDHAAEMARWQARAERIVARLQGVAGLTARTAINTSGFIDADLAWDQAIIPLDRDGLRRLLKEGSPRVELEVVITNDPGTTMWHATARTRTMRDGEELLVADRLRQVFQARS